MATGREWGSLFREGNPHSSPPPHSQGQESQLPRSDLPTRGREFGKLTAKTTSTV